MMMMMGDLKSVWGLAKTHQTREAQVSPSCGGLALVMLPLSTILGPGHVPRQGFCR